MKCFVLPKLKSSTLPKWTSSALIAKTLLINQKHIDSVLALDLVDVEAIRKADFRVAIDCVNSVGGIILPQLLEQLGVRHGETLLRAYW